MDVVEQPGSADAGVMLVPPYSSAALVTASTDNLENNNTSPTTGEANESAVVEAIEDESFESPQSGDESDDLMWDVMSSSVAAQDQSTDNLENDNNGVEPDVEAIEILVVERDPDIDVEVDQAAEHDPLDASDADENEADDEQDVEQDEDQMQEFAVDMVFNMINREAAAEADNSAVEPLVGERLHSQVNALRSDAMEIRDRFHYPLRSQQLLQIRRALLVIDRNRLIREQQRLSNGSGSNVAAGGGDNGDEELLAAEDEGIAELVEGEQQINIEVDAAPENPIRFDTNLAAEHSYLGANMNRVSGVEYLDVGEEYNMMLFLHQHIVYPGEVLPFMISGSIIDADIDSTNGMLLGVCFPFMRCKDNANAIYGVTCQIYEKGTDERGHTLIKSRALQRFVTSNTQIEHLEYINDNPRLKHGNVRILPEIYMCEPLKCINMGSMNRFRDIPSMEHQFQRYQAASTAWPAHIYNYYNMTSIVEKARKSLAHHEIETMPTDPIQLSFWLARNLHLSEELMKNIFMNDTVNLRMKIIDKTLKADSIFVCRICGNRIANCSELFAMSKHGVQTQYCNSAGYIHETNTVYQLLREAVSYSGDPSSEFSWFPGYKWHIVVCKVCTRHIGWEFKAMEPNLVPKSFFGISSSSVRVSDTHGAPTNPREEIFRNFMRLARREVQ